MHRCPPFCRTRLPAKHINGTSAKHQTQLIKINLFRGNESLQKLTTETLRKHSINKSARVPAAIRKRRSASSDFTNAVAVEEKLIRSF